MELIRGLHNLQAQHRGCVASIGNYDGVHLGHRAVLQTLADHGRELGRPRVVVTFEPHPQEFFRGAAAGRITPLRDKLEAFAALGIERVLLLRFNAALARLEPESFIEQVLVEGLAVRYLMAGDDFRFGHHRRGDTAMLREFGARDGFGVGSLPTCLVDGTRVSSTRIRHCLTAGDFATAARLLGRPYLISGRIAHGDKLGRRWGVPTANIDLARRPPPVSGIFAALVHGCADRPLPGAASIGTRPTVGGQGMRLEVHVLDFDGDLYGHRLRVELCAKLRDEEKFDSIDALRRQIFQDVHDTRRYFSGAEPALPDRPENPQ